MEECGEGSHDWRAHMTVSLVTYGTRVIALQYMEPTFKVCVIIVAWCDIKGAKACRTAQIHKWYLQFTNNATILLYSRRGTEIKTVCTVGNILKCVGGYPNEAQPYHLDADMPQVVIFEYHND